MANASVRVKEKVERRLADLARDSASDSESDDEDDWQEHFDRDEMRVFLQSLSGQESVREAAGASIRKEFSG